MTAPHLLAWILSALLLQVALGVAVALWRRRHAPSLAPADATGNGEPALRAQGKAAWPGTRDCRVRSRIDEDRAGTQCSFCLEPVDGLPLPDFGPGQFLTFMLQVSDPSAGGAPCTVTRCYSLSDRPLPSHYRVTIKRVPAPGLSSNHFHDVECATCHRNNDYAAYTCYGCHEHTPAGMRKEHAEEGTRDIDNCVECHRDPGVEPDKQGRTGSESRRKRERD